MTLCSVEALHPFYHRLLSSSFAPMIMAHQSCELSEMVMTEPNTGPNVTPMADQPRPSGLTVQTTWGSNLTTAVGSQASPDVEELDPEKQNHGAVCYSWPGGAKSALRRMFCPRSVRLENSASGEHAAAIPQFSFQADPRTKLEDLPMGYPRLAGFQASDEAFSIYRGFSYLHARVILDLQYEISDLERKLIELDEEDNDGVEGSQRLRSRSNDEYFSRNSVPIASARRDIIGKIQEKLAKYDEALLNAREMVMFQKPNQRDYKSVAGWFNDWKPLVQDEWYSLKQQDDMITLRQGREWAMFDGWVESLLRRCEPWCPLIGRIFRPERIQEMSSDEHMHYYHSRRVEGLVAIIITTIIFILLVIPVVLMYNLTSIGSRRSTFDAIGVLVVFTLVFSAAMSLLTKAKRHELFGASAAYCAVLVVFISNFGGTTLGGN